MLHGQPGSARDWRGLEAELNGQFDTLAIDRPGYTPGTLPGGIAHSGEAAVAALDGAGLGRALIVGHSFGGAVAAWLAVHHPERVEGLVLVAPAANVASLLPVDRVLAAPVIGPLVSAAMLTGASLALRSGRLRSRATLKAVVTEQRALMHEIPLLDDELHLIATPTTIVFGSEDQVVPPDATKRLARQISGARLVKLEGAGHLLPWEHPKEIAEAILTTAAAVAR
jgi:pimeloyl-ACP methyl ester carboxylesterase